MKVVTACPSCGARVDAPPRDTPYVHQCHYCGINIPIEPFDKPKPPPQPQAQRFEVHVQAPPRIVVTGRPIWASLVWIVVVVAIAGAGAVKALLRGTGITASFPLTVGINESVEIDDKTFTATSGTVATVGVNGKLTLKRCHLKGPIIVKSEMNGEIEFDGCTLDATSNVVQADVNTKVTFDNTTATANGPVVKGEVNAKVFVQNSSKVKSTGGTAIDLGTNGEVTVDGSRVEGKVAAIKGGMNLKVNATSSQIIAPQHAIEGGMNASITETGSEITGSATAAPATPAAPAKPPGKHH